MVKWIYWVNNEIVILVIILCFKFNKSKSIMKRIRISNHVLSLIIKKDRLLKNINEIYFIININK